MRSHRWKIFRWQVLRYLARHRLLAALNIFSVALGVAVFLATQLANQSANRAFHAAFDLVAGKADLEITAPAGDLREDFLPAIARIPGIAAATPLARGIVTLPDFAGDYLEILGIDIFTNESFRTFELTDFTEKNFDFETWLARPNTIAITEDFAALHHLKAGDTLRAQVNASEQQLRVSFVMRGRDMPISDSHFAAIDLGWAQELIGRRGFLSSIQIRLARGDDREVVSRELHKILPPNIVVAVPARRSEQVEKMLGGFELNLTAMSLVSLLVGLFLIYNTVSASVIRRRREIGILRSLGATRREIFLLLLSEALVLGAVGSALGLTSGLLLARVLVGAVSGTISSLYVVVSVQSIALRPITFLAAFAIGIVTAALGAWWPARLAARLDPVRVLQNVMTDDEARDVPRLWATLGVVSILLATILSLLALATGPPWLGFGAALFVLLGFSFFAPPVIAIFCRVTQSLARGRLETNLAARNLNRSLARNSVTIAALATAIAMTVGVSVMIFSFRQTVAAWIDQTLIADLFIGPASNEIAGPTSFMPPAAIQFLRQRPEVAALNTFREINLSLGQVEIAVAVVDGVGRRRLNFVRGNQRAIMQRFENETAVIVSESFARRHHVRDGDSLALETPRGTQSFAIAGTFYDYTRDDGIVYMTRQTFARFWNDDRVNSIAVYLKSGSVPNKLIAEFRANFSRAGQFSIFSNAALRQRVFEIFDQTFAVTQVLRAIAIIVAVLGIFLSFTILIAERTREFAIIRAIGGSARQIRKLLVRESAMLGLLAAALGLASGLCLAIVLTGVINRAFFGWTIRLTMPWWSLALTPCWIIFAAIVAGCFPARQAARLRLDESLRDE